MVMQEKYLKPDSKGRIQLGRLAKDVVRYHVIEESDGKIILFPEVAIPASEAWLYKNKKALEAVKKGLEDSASGKVKKRGSFAKYIDEE
ncbi:MAG TPA: hypothetical protein P5556_07300 [Candidatus Gastranaerophilales bacterium]|nr:hypothetical protein [Candidatus Gastranaerophilales bacterium]